jgi:urease accessory protein
VTVTALAVSSPPALQRAQGAGRLTASHRAGATPLDRLYQEGCAKIRLPNTHSAALEAVVINTAGGLTGGDYLSWSVEAGAETRVVVTTQACERIYRSTGADARVETRLTAGPNAHLDWLPQETILFESSRLDRSLDIDLDEGASLTAIETILLGREAMGEVTRRAHLRDNWRVRRCGRLIHAEATRLSGIDAEHERISLLAGRNAFATVLHVAANAELAERRYDTLVSHLPADHRIGLGIIGERLIVRVLAENGHTLRRLITPVLAELAGAGHLPRLWHL